MMRLELPRGAGASIRTVLCLGAHSDDIEIGCGATVLRLTREIPDLTVHWVVLSSSKVRASEARESAEAFLSNAGSRQLIVHNFRNGYFPWVGAELKDCFEALKTTVDPDLIFSHYRHDLHQDHRTVSDLTWNTFRDHVILEYEIPKYDGGLGSPGLFAPVSAEAVDQKIEWILRFFTSQKESAWFSPETFRSLLRLRGVECNSPSGYAEGFYARKIVV